MRLSISWNRALILSCCIHGLVFLALAGAGLFCLSDVPEEYIEVEIAAGSAVSGQVAAASAPQAARRAGEGETAVKSGAMPVPGTEKLRFDNVTGNRPDNAPYSTGSGAETVAADGGDNSAGTSAAAANMAEKAGGSASRQIMRPSILHRVEPVYPEEARQQGGEGLVVVRIQILTDGSTGEVSVQQSSGVASLDEAAVQAARLWRFVPARDAITGLPVICYESLPIRFKFN